LVEHLTDRDAVDLQDAAEVGLGQGGDGVAAEGRRETAGGGSDPPFESETDGPGTGADASFGDRARLDGRDRAEHVVTRDDPAADVVQLTVVRLPDDGVDRTDAFVARPGQRVLD
jgi:hypothetical protein